MDQIVIKEKKTPHYVLFEISGKINSYTYADFQNRVYTAMQDTTVIVDLSHVAKLTSHGVSVLIAAHDKAFELNRKFYIMQPSEIVRKTIEDTGFFDIFFIIHSVTEVSAAI